MGLHEPAAGNGAMRLMLSFVFFLFNLYREGLASLPRAWICPVMRVKTMSTSAQCARLFRWMRVQRPFHARAGPPDEKDRPLQTRAHKCLRIKEQHRLASAPFARTVLCFQSCDESQ